jgi:hypothetical protein
MWAHIPVWAFAALWGLIAIGWHQTRTRLVEPTLLISAAVALLAYPPGA